MGQQGKNTKSEIVDFPYLSSNKDVAWQGRNSVSSVDQKNLRTEEEINIWQELEMDIERNLEEEIKDGIYHLALRLHRLHQHRKQRSNERELKTISEVNITIKMEGGTKVEIKETTKKGDQAVLPRKSNRPRSSKLSENSKSMQIKSSKKNFNWENSLRSESGPIIMHKNIHGCQASLVSNDHRRDMRIVTGNNARKPLDLGWKIQD